MFRNCMIATAASLALASMASATIYTGDGFTIPDNNPAGASSDIVIGDEFLVADITVTLFGLNHTWAGDLIATLTHVESGFSQTLFSRIGATTPGGVGDSSNFGGDYSFNDAFAGDLWVAAAGGTTGFVIPGGDYFASGALSSAQVSLLDIFGGLNAQGTWRLTISDNAGADLGTLGAWGLDFVKAPVPAPGALALLGLAGLAGGRRRRA